MAFTFSDLFAGIGGFHAALGALGGECWFTSEIDRNASAVYDYNWLRPQRDGFQDEKKVVSGDIVPLTDPHVFVPPTDVLAAGFPCQPFSKSGFQRGMDETRGTLFWNIARVLEEHQPPVLLLENVRNLAGPNHKDTWATIVRTLRESGYRVSSVPAVFSPHLIGPEFGGRPQVRERVFIMAHKVGKGGNDGRDDAPIVVPKPIYGWNPLDWSLDSHLLQDDAEIEHLDRYVLPESDQAIIEIWDDLLDKIVDRLDGGKLPGFPVWADEFRTLGQAEDVIDASPVPVPAWKADFLRKNARFYEQHRAVIDSWKDRHDNLDGLAPSRRKLEWQAQDPTSLWDTVMHFRPSGIRAKRPTYLPALVAITQTSIIGSRKRRITPREAARLQGLPDWFEFRHVLGDGTVEEQPDAATYRQLGNGVNVGAAYFVFRRYVLEHRDEIAEHAPHVVEAVAAASENPDEMLTTPLEARPLPMAAQGRGRGVMDLLVGEPQEATAPA
ncbi:DNA (cytosine-5-)-methyltransferase [Isoptericola sp. QY 916]|uniref:DNA (cytosine-5-)-methyltransferase n=1 Tax=Isoptericola sp. QY 916 TaxID=2782570 RepID=UPI003D2FE76C|nr:DNA (cytosine-5-)-methyltransferase [Isoptericola sp. QY 916]